LKEENITSKHVGEEIGKTGSMGTEAKAQRQTEAKTEETGEEADGISVEVALLNLGDTVTILLLPEPENGGKKNRYGLATWVARGGAVRMIVQVQSNSFSLSLLDMLLTYSTNI
jgi:hypothetical protein